MAFSFLPFTPQPQPRVGFDTLNRALEGVAQDRLRREQMRIQREQLAQQKLLADQKAAALLTRQGIEDRQWSAEQEAEAEKQRQMQEYRKAQLSGQAEGRELQRSKAEAEFLGDVRRHVLEGGTEEGLKAFMPAAQVLGMDLGPRTVIDPWAKQQALQLPDYDPNQDPQAFVGQIEAAVEKAVDAAQPPPAPSPASQLLPGVDLAALQAQQAQRVAGPLQAAAANVRTQDQPAFQMASRVAPHMLGTPLQRVQQATALGRQEADRSAAWRRAQVAARQRGEASGRAERSFEEQQYDRGLKQFKTVMAEHKNRETVDKITVLQEALGKLQKDSAGKINPASAMEAFYMIAKAREGGRLTEEDFQRSFGLQDVRTKLTNWIQTGVEAQLSDAQIRRTLGMLRSNYKDAVKKMKRDYRAAERLKKRLPEGSRRTAVEDMIDTTFGGMEFYYKEKSGSKSAGRKVPGDIQALLKKAEQPGGS